jgi:hypothetical protein
MLVLLLPDGKKIPLEPYEADKSGPAFFPVAHIDMAASHSSNGELPLSERMATAGLIMNKQPWQL